MWRLECCCVLCSHTRATLGQKDFLSHTLSDPELTASTVIFLLFWKNINFFHYCHLGEKHSQNNFNYFPIKKKKKPKTWFRKCLVKEGNNKMLMTTSLTTISYGICGYRNNWFFFLTSCFEFQQYLKKH